MYELADEPRRRESIPAVEAEKASHGRLQKRLFVVISTATKVIGAVKEHLPSQLAYLTQLEREGKLFMAGPLFNETPDRWSGDGLLIYNAQDHAEALKIAQDDPLHKSSARTFSIRTWLVNDGLLNITIRLSDQSAKFQ